MNVSAPEDASPEEVERLARRLSDAGMRVERTLPEIGAISGAVDDPADLDALQAAAGEGVTIEEDREYQLPDPDDPVQ